MGISIKDSTKLTELERREMFEHEKKQMERSAAVCGNLLYDGDSLGIFLTGTAVSLLAGLPDTGGRLDLYARRAETNAAGRLL